MNAKDLSAIKFIAAAIGALREGREVHLPPDAPFRVVEGEGAEMARFSWPGAGAEMQGAAYRPSAVRPGALPDVVPFVSNVWYAWVRSDPAGRLLVTWDCQDSASAQTTFVAVAKELDAMGLDRSPQGPAGMLQLKGAGREASLMSIPFSTSVLLTLSSAASESETT